MLIKPADITIKRHRGEKSYIAVVVVYQRQQLLMSNYNGYRAKIRERTIFVSPIASGLLSRKSAKIVSISVPDISSDFDI
jgi:hypothetical protein